MYLLSLNTRSICTTHGYGTMDKQAHFQISVRSLTWGSRDIRIQVSWIIDGSIFGLLSNLLFDMTFAATLILSALRNAK